MKIKPLADRLLVKPIEEDDRTPGGIILPDTASKEKPMQGKVIAAGPGRVDDKGARVAMEVKEGQTVLYGKYSGTDIKMDNEDYLILKESDVLAIVE